MPLPKLPPDSKPIIRKEPNIGWVMLAFSIVVLALGILAIIQHI